MLEYDKNGQVATGSGDRKEEGWGHPDSDGMGPPRDATQENPKKSHTDDTRHQFSLKTLSFRK